MQAYVHNHKHIGLENPNLHSNKKKKHIYQEFYMNSKHFNIYKKKIYFILLLNDLYNWFYHVFILEYFLNCQVEKMG